jgi:hypothetical protein
MVIDMSLREQRSCPDAMPPDDGNPCSQSPFAAAAKKSAADRVSLRTPVEAGRNITVDSALSPISPGRLPAQPVDDQS